MIVVAALLIAGLVQGGSQGPASGQSILGRTVELSLPAAVPDPARDAVLNWDGFKYAAQGARKWPARQASVGDWSALKPIFDDARSHMSPSTPVWRCHIVVADRCGILDRRADGLVRNRRSSIDSSEFDAISQSIVRFQAMVESASGGAIRAALDVVEENDFLHGATGSEAPPFGAAYWRDYLEPRVNGGSFEADDKVFRGPFSSVFVIHPALAGSSSVAFAVNGLPATAIPYRFFDPGSGEAGLPIELYRGWVSHVRQWATRKGFKVPEGSGLPDGLNSDVWASLSDAKPATGAQYVANSAIPLRASIDKIATLPLIRPSATTANASLTIVPDDERGNVMEFASKGNALSGAASLPQGDAWNLAAKPFLKFSVKTTSREPISIVAVDPAGTELGDVVVGNDPGPTADGLAATGHVVGTSVANDGKWHTVVVDLRKLSPPQDAVIAGFDVRVFPRAAFFASAQAQPVEAKFAEFEALAGLPQGMQEDAVAPPSPNALSESIEDRELAILKIGSDATPEQIVDLARLLKDPSNDVRLNAAVKLQTVKAPTVVPDLIEAGISIDDEVGNASLRALAYQDTDAAWTAVRHAVDVAPAASERQTAMELVSAKRGAQVGIASLLLTSRSWQARRAAIVAIGSIPGATAQNVLSGFFELVDPAVRLAAVTAADPNDGHIVRALMRAAVNDASDSMRAASYAKLLEAKAPETRGEGLKGVRDDSRWVRLKVTEWLLAHAEESNRPALRLAVTDSDAEVRAAALRAFAAIQGPVSLDEIGPASIDPHPVVQAALIDLAVAKRLALGADALKSLKSSVDPAIAKRAESLGG